MSSSVKAAGSVAVAEDIKLENYSKSFLIAVFVSLAAYVMSRKAIDSLDMGLMKQILQNAMVYLPVAALIAMVASVIYALPEDKKGVKIGAAVAGVVLTGALVVAELANAGVMSLPEFQFGLLNFLNSGPVVGGSSVFQGAFLLTVLLAALGLFFADRQKEVMQPKTAEPAADAPADASAPTDASAPVAGTVPTVVVAATLRPAAEAAQQSAPAVVSSDKPKTGERGVVLQAMLDAVNHRLQLKQGGRAYQSLDTAVLNDATRQLGILLQSEGTRNDYEDLVKGGDWSGPGSLMRQITDKSAWSDSAINIRFQAVLADSLAGKNKQVDFSQCKTAADNLGVYRGEYERIEIQSPRR